MKKSRAVEWLSELASNVRRLHKPRPGGADGSRANVARGISEHILRRERKERRITARGERRFVKRHRKRWRESLLISHAFLRGSLELGSLVNEAERPRASLEHDAKFEAMIRNHARACRVASEVLFLAESGYASAALARWRTMHEIAVVCRFLKENDSEWSRRYLLYDAIDSYKSAKSHDQHADRFQCIRPTPEELAAVQAARGALEGRYGKEFTKEYGWAHGAVKGKPTFDAIQRAVNLEHWHPRYKLASQEAHAEAKATYWNLSAGPQSDFLLVGQSTEGLAEALHPMMLSLNMVTGALVELWPTDSRLLHVAVLVDLADMGGDALVREHRASGIQEGDE